MITWAEPADIVVGTALSATQLNATSSTPGTFVYTPASGTVLSVGVQELSAAFTPTDTVNYSSSTTTVLINVKPLPSITLSATTIAPGGTVTATVANGPGNRTDWIGLYTAGGSTELDWKYLNGSRTAPATGSTGAAVSFTMPTTPGPYTLRFLAGSTLLASSATITVAAAAAPTLTLDTAAAATGGTVTATIANGPGLTKDWIGLYATGGSTLLDWKVPERVADGPGHRRDCGLGAVHDASDARHLHAEILHRHIHGPGDERDDYRDGRRWRDAHILGQPDDGCARRHRDGDAHQRTGCREGLDRPVFGRRIVARMEVSERDAGRAGHRADGRDGALLHADGAGHVYVAVLYNGQHAPGDERHHYGRDRLRHDADARARRRSDPAAS